MKEPDKVCAVDIKVLILTGSTFQFVEYLKPNAALFLMKNLLLKYLLLLLCMAQLPARAQIPERYEAITEAEVKAFMQQVLWFCNYDHKFHNQPNEQFMGFLEDSLQQNLKNQEKVRYQFELYGALISKIDLPWVEVLATNGIDSRNWRSVKRFRVTKKEGKLYLMPQYKKTWTTTSVSAWQEEFVIPIRSATEEEKAAIRKDVIAFLDQRFPKPEPVNWKREQLLGHWRIDSTYYFREGQKISSFSLAEYLMLYDGKFYNVNGAYIQFGGDFLNHPGWWGLRNNYLFTSDGIQVDLLTVEEVSPHRILLKRIDSYGPYFLILSDLPREKYEPEPVPIEHPDVKVVLQPTYDYIGSYNDTLAEVQSEYYSGLIDQSGQLWLPLVYDQLLPFNGRPFTYGQRNGQWYKINAQGEEFETLPYDDFIDMLGLVLVVKDKKGKVGAMDQAGNVIIPFEYEMVLPQGDNFYQVIKNRKTGLADQSGQEIIPPKYDDLMQIENGLYKAILSGKEGIIDPAIGEFLIEPEYEYISRADRYYQTKRNDRLVLFDLQFQEIELPDYELMIYQGDGYLGVEENGKRGIVDIQGKVLVPIEYDDVWLASAGILVKQEGLWGLLDHKGKVVIPLVYDAMEFNGDLIRVKKKESWGVLDHSGKEVLAPKYEELILDHRNPPIQYGRVQENGKMRLINLNGEYLIKTTYDEVHFPRPLFPGFEEQWCAFKNNDKHGYLNSEGEVAIPAKYDFYFFFESGGYAVAELDGKYGIINTENKVLVPFIFDYLTFQPDQPVITVQYEGFYGLIKNPVYGSVNK